MLWSRNAWQGIIATSETAKTLCIKISDDLLSLVTNKNGGISSSLLSGSGALIRNRRMLSLGRSVTYGTDGSSETRLSKSTDSGPLRPTRVSGLMAGRPTRPHSSGRKRGMVTRHLNEADDVPTKIVKAIGDMCGMLIYTVIVGLVLYAVLR